MIQTELEVQTKSYTRLERTFGKFIYLNQMMFITQCSLASTTSKSGFHQLIHCWLVLTLIEYLTRTFDFSRNMNSTVKVCVFLAVFVSFDVIGNAFNFEGWFHY